jgi:hypothetical protein
MRFGGAVLDQLPYLLVDCHLLEQCIDFLLDLWAGELRVGRCYVWHLRENRGKYKERETGEQGGSTVGHTDSSKVLYRPLRPAGSGQICHPKKK